MHLSGADRSFLNLLKAEHDLIRYASVNVPLQWDGTTKVRESHRISAASGAAPAAPGPALAAAAAATRGSVTRAGADGS